MTLPGSPPAARNRSVSAAAPGAARASSGAAKITPLPRRSGQRLELGKPHRLVADQFRLETAGADLARDDGGVGLLRSDHDRAQRRVLQATGERDLALLARRETLGRHALGPALLVELARGLHEALPVDAAVVDEPHPLVAIEREQAIRHGARLQVRARDDAEYPRPDPLVGEARVGGRRRDQQDAVLGVDPRGGKARAGAGVTDHEHDTLADQLVRDRRPGLRVALVVDDHRPEFLAADAAAALTSATAASTPARISEPIGAKLPDIGPAMPTSTAAVAGEAASVGTRRARIRNGFIKEKP